MLDQIRQERIMELVREMKQEIEYYRCFYEGEGGSSCRNCHREHKACQERIPVGWEPEDWPPPSDAEIRTAYCPMCIRYGLDCTVEPEDWQLPCEFFEEA